MLYPEQAMDQKSPQLTQIESANPKLEGRRLFGLDAEALTALMAQAGEPAFRARQLAEALYRQRMDSLDAITTLPKALRQRLAGEGWQVGRPSIAQVFHSTDGTERYLVEVGDGLTVETVWMPEGDDGEAGNEIDVETSQNLGAPGPDFRTWEASELQSTHKPVHRATICVSSQIGCAVNCQFCLTAKLGLQRNLTAGEIAGQVLAVLDRHAVQAGRDRVNLVFMGMGEPFLNYDSFMAAVRLLVREVGLSPRRMTVSTSGIVPGILRFAAELPELRPKLAISLNAPNDTVRGEIMPINRKWPIAELIDAARQINLRPRERITFEYVLLGGVTDQLAHARALARLFRRSGLNAKVNLIAWNPGPGIAYSTPQPEAVEAFRGALIRADVPTYLRKPRGRDIYAACGQLKRTVEE